jgi:hypothetical protein
MEVYSIAMKEDTKDTKSPAEAAGVPDDDDDDNILLADLMTRRTELEAREYEASVGHVGAEGMHQEYVCQDTHSMAQAPQKLAASIPPTPAARSDSDMMPSVVWEVVQQRASRAVAADMQAEKYTEGSHDMEKDILVDIDNATDQVAVTEPAVGTITESARPLAIPALNRVAPQRQSNPRPGAYMQGPGESLQRATTLRYALLRVTATPADGNNGVDPTHVGNGYMGDDRMGDDGIHATPTGDSSTALEATNSNRDTCADMAVAFPVVEDSENGAMMQANPVDMDKVQKKQEEETSRKLCFGWSLIFAFFSVPIILGSVFGTQQKALASTAVPTILPSMSPSAAPSMAPSGVLDFLMMQLPNYTPVNLQDFDTPQSRAWTWLSKHRNITNLPEWRKKQLFALATFFYAFEGVRWHELIQARWMDDTLDECFWFSSGLGRFVDGHYVEWSQEKDFVTARASCNEHGEFLSLSLQGLQLSGMSPSLPPEIALLTSLSDIGLFTNGIDATLQTMLPSEIGQLVNCLVY